MKGTARTERVAAEMQAALGEVLARGDVKDPRVRVAGIITVTHVRVTGDLRAARVSFTVFGADDQTLERVRQGLTAAHAHLQREVAHRLKMRNTATLTFEIDRALDEALRMGSLLRTVAAETPSVTGADAATVDAAAASGDDDADDDTVADDDDR